MPRLVLAVFLLVTLALSSGLALDYGAFVRTPLRLNAAETLLEVPRGTSLRTLADTLSERGLIKHPYYFLAMAYLRGDHHRIKAGDYALAPGLRPGELLDRLVAGQVVVYRVTLIEGWTFRRALEALDADSRFAGEPLGALSDAEIMARLDRADLHPEGRFFPDTYVFRRAHSRLDLLRRALERMDRVLAEEWAKRAPKLPLNSPDEALVLASIIEKEAMLAREQPIISGVFIRRLNRGMRLQTDPTVIYGLGDDFDGDLKRVHLRTPTPYNTYVNHGLPPTPIALPGRGAIHAALHPAPGKALFFVARGDGSHVFSATYAEHQKAVRRYILGQN